MPTQVHEMLNKLAQNLDSTMDEVILLICNQVFNSRYVMGEIGLYFKKNLIVEKTFYMGCSVLEFNPSKVDNQLYVKLNIGSYLYESLSAIAHSLDSTIADAIILILEFFLGIRKSVYSTEKIGQMKYIN